MDTLVQLSVCEVLAVFSDVSGYLHDQTRKRCIPINTAPFAVPAVANSATVAGIEVNVNNVSIGYLKKLYACYSGRAKVTLEHELDVYSLLDHRSELNIMP
jgi:hypothetical protein